MVTIKKHPQVKNLSIRLKKAEALVGESGKASLVQLKSARRSDQRSAFSIAGSACSSSGSTLKRDEAPLETLVTIATANERTKDAALFWPSMGSQQVAGAAQRNRLWCRNSRCAKSVFHGWPHAKFLLTNSGASNSVVLAEAQTEAVSKNHLAKGSQNQQCSSRRSFDSVRQAQTVSISTSQEGHTGCSKQLLSSHLDLTTKRSIIKLRPLPQSVLKDAHNGLAVPQAPQAPLAPQTPQEYRKVDSTAPPQVQRGQEIFRECHFIPSNTFYKKVIVAPNQDRRFFANPRCLRVPGSRMLYDTLADNAGHHRDVNIDFTRDAVKKVCSNFCKPSQFRHMW